MKCPHCEKSISHFSAAILGPTKPGGKRKCPHCSQSFTITGNFGIALITALLSATIGFFLLRPIPFVGFPLWGFTIALLTFIAAARLKKVIK